MDKDWKFYLASVCVFHSGAIALALFGLDWLGWSMMASAVVLWVIGMKHDQ